MKSITRKRLIENLIHKYGITDIGGGVYFEGFTDALIFMHKKIKEMQVVKK